MTYLGTVLTFAFANNVVLTYFLGFAPAETGRRSSIRRAALLALMMVAASVLTWVARRWLLVPIGAEFLQTVLFVLVVLGLSHAAVLLLRRLNVRYADDLTSIAANCVVTGVALVVVRGQYHLVDALLAGAGAAVGYLVCTGLLAHIARMLETESVPRPFRGAPIVLISAGLVALAFLAFDLVLLAALLE